jgi:hypothetical protein
VPLRITADSSVCDLAAALKNKQSVWLQRLSLSPGLLGVVCDAKSISAVTITHSTFSPPDKILPMADMLWILDSLSQLTHLAILRADLSAQTLTFLRYMDKLRTLNLSRSIPLQNKLHVLPSSLTSLDLSFTEANDANMECVRGLKLRTLNLAHTLVTEVGLACAAGAPVETLDISYCRVTSLAVLAALPLTSLNLSHCGSVGSGSLEFLRGKTLKHLNLSLNWWVGDDSLMHLMDASVESLNLHCCLRISNLGVGCLQPPLACLDLSNSGVNADCATHLAHLSLRRLTLPREVDVDAAPELALRMVKENEDLNYEEQAGFVVWVARDP